MSGPFCFSPLWTLKLSLHCLLALTASPYEQLLRDALLCVCQLYSGAFMITFQSLGFNLSTVVNVGVILILLGVYCASGVWDGVSQQSDRFGPLFPHTVFCLFLALLLGTLVLWTSCHRWVRLCWSPFGLLPPWSLKSGLHLPSTIGYWMDPVKFPYYTF